VVLLDKDQQNSHKMNTKTRKGCANNKNRGLLSFFNIANATIWAIMTIYFSQNYFDAATNIRPNNLPEEVAKQPAESKMILLKPQIVATADKTPPQNWTIPVADDPKCPSFCGKKMEFAAFATISHSDLTLDKGIGSKTFYRAHRPDLISNMSKAVAEIDKHGGMDTNSYCKTFDSCGKKKKTRQNRHSSAFLVCSDFQMVLAADFLKGSAQESLPGYLKDEGDDNVLCQLAGFISKTVEQTIFPFVGWENKKCIVQEFFINQQMTGSKTIRHVHNDDTYGGLFYLDVPKDTRLCFDDNENTKQKKKWWKHAPELTERLFPDGPGNYPGYVEPRAGDIVLLPVGWAQHWVPHMQFAGDEKRTSVVFNMACF
jgi:hypothetical protein